MTMANMIPGVQETNIVHSLIHLHIPEPEATCLLRLLTSAGRDKRFPATVAALQILHPWNSDVFVTGA